VTDAVGEAAAGGNLYAGLALIVAGADTTQVMALARQRLDAAVAPRIHQPGVRTFGTGLAQTALLVSVLPEDDRVRFARGMLDFANDGQESAPNRYQALIALHDIARDLPDRVRHELFGQTLPFVQGMREQADDELLPKAADPLSRFRFSLGEASLTSAGLMAIAAMANSPDQFDTVRRNAVIQLRSATEQTANASACALASLPPEEMTLPVDILAAHPSQWLRALAAVVWAQSSDQPPEIGTALAQDPSTHVRGSLARSLGNDAHHASPRDILASDPRRSVRQQVKD
jgi:hypothetical protein